MNTTSKLKKNTKTQTKQTTVRKQTSRKANEQLTTRASKQVTKKKQSQQSGHKGHRSPQMIKMMINELEKQLAEKTKFSKTLNEGQFRSTARKLASPKNAQLGSKTATSTQNGWRSPQKKMTKDTIIESSDKGSSKQLQKSMSQKGSMKKKKIVYSSIQPFDTSLSNKKIESKIQPSQKVKQKKIKKQKGKDFIFLGDDLIKLDNIQIPLFIVQSNKTDLERSKRFSSRNEKFIEVDERSSYLRHSKISSFNSVNSQKSSVQPVKFIERSFVEGQSRTSNELDIEFLNNTNNFFSKNQSKQNEVSIISTQKTIKNPDPVFDINQIIRLNNSVVKIQKWWKKLLKRRQLKMYAEKLKLIKQRAVKEKNEKITSSLPQQNIITVSQGEKLNLSEIQAEVQTPTLSENAIPSPNTQKQYEDILKLRQTAAHIQFSTHQQILKQLLSKKKINLLQYNQKLTKIKENLQKQLNEINNIKKILKQSAKKVEDMMKKTKDDILVVKQITATQQEVLGQSRVSEQLQQRNKQNGQKDDILATIFGKQQIKQTSIQNSPQKFQKKVKRLKVSTYQKDIQQFLDQDKDDQNSFSSNQNRKVFNSPTSGSQEYLCSPKSSNKSDSRNLDDLPDYGENIDEAAFATEISKVPINTVNEAQTESMSPSMQTANFQQLYKQYQQQQQTKRQIELRISKQLGVTDPQDMLSKSQDVIGINTSIVGIHKFLLNFFKFYLYYHKNQFLSYMNMPYGESIETRLAKNKQKDSQIALENWTQTTLYTDDDQQIIYGLKYVIPESVLQDFFESYYEQTDVQFTEVQKANIELQKIHNKSVFQAFNIALNFFRPYYNIGGAPYLWCSSEKSLTFYCIGEENIQQVYEKTQMKILKNSSYLCGPHIDVAHKNKVKYQKNDLCKDKQEEYCEQINSPFKIMEIQQKSSNAKSQKIINDFEQFLLSYTENFNPAYFANLEDRLKKKQLAQAEEQNPEWFSNTFEECKVSTLLSITDLITQILFQEQFLTIQKIYLERQNLLNYV